MLTLSTTYRCPKAVVRLAQSIVPHYQFAPESPEGEILHQWKEQETVIGDTILSRLNAPIDAAGSFFPAPGMFQEYGLKAGTLASNFWRWLGGFKAVSVPNFLDKIRMWESKQVARLSKSRNPEKKLEQTRDIAQTLTALAQDAKSISGIDARIKTLFEDTTDKSKPVVLPIHSSQGKKVWNGTR